MNGGYILVDCSGLDLTDSNEQTISGLWNKAVAAIATQKPIVASGSVYGTGKPVSPVTCFGWYISATEIVIVGATLHIHIKNTDKVTVLDVASA